MYIVSMQRTQMYLDEKLRKDLIALAKREDKSMAQVARDILKEGVKKKKNGDKSGIDTLIAISKMRLKGGDDPYLSSNIDHYLYGAPKKKQ